MINRFIFFVAAILISIIFLSCSGDMSPIQNDITRQKFSSDSDSQTHLWAYYDVFINPETFTVELSENRSALFTANVVNFLNSKQTAMSVKINGITHGADYTDIDLDVGLTHPFPGMPQYNGYDVRGVFMGDGSATLATSGVVYPMPGTDQFMLDDPDFSGTDLPGGGPDGFTRWFNKTEFSMGGMPLFSYTPGKLASKNFNGTATLCPYKYFADSLGANDDVWSWLKDHGNLKGVFSSGATNSRNYYIRFPKTKGIIYGYAVIANWNGPEPQDHPSNAPEAVSCSIVDNSDVYYVDATENGGNLNLDISLWGWSGQPSAIHVESTVLLTPYTLDSSEMIPTGGDENYSSWHVEIPADDVGGLNGNEYWIIAEYDDDYSNDFGIGNLAETEPLMAYFRYDLDVADEAPATNHDPVCVLIVISTEFESWEPLDIEFDASESYDPDGDPLTFDWDFDGDGLFNETNGDDNYTGNPDNPKHTYTNSFTGEVSVRVSDGNGGVSICTTELNILIHDCATPAMPSGYMTEHPHFGPSLWMVAGIDKVKGATKEYGISWCYRYYSQMDPPEVKYGLVSFELTGSGIVTNHYSEDATMYNQLIGIGGMVVTSTNRVYIHGVMSNFDKDLIYYSDWNESTGFTMPIKPTSFPKITGWTIYEMSIDTYNNPIALCYRSTAPRLSIQHWNGSVWEQTLIADSSAILAENYGSVGQLYDFAYNPMTDTYWITNQANHYYNSSLGKYYWRGTPTIYCIANDGTLAWKKTDVYPEIASNTDAGAFLTGVYIDIYKPDCRVLVELGCYAWVFNPGPPPGVFKPRTVRYDAAGTELGRSDMPYPDNKGYYQYAIGSVITWGGKSYYTCPTNFDLLGTLEIPDW